MTHVLAPTSRWQSFMVAIALTGVLLISWEGLAKYGNATTNFSSPSLVAQELVSYVLSGRAHRAFVISLSRAWIGLIIGTLAGFLLGGVATLYAPTHRFFSWIVASALSYPRLALFLLFLLWFPLGDGPKIALIAWIAFILQFSNVFYLASEWLYGNTYPDDTEQLLSARIDGAGRWSMYCYMLVPKLLPTSLMAFRVATGYAWSYLVYVETFASNRGIGWEIFMALQDGSATVMISRTIILMLGAGLTMYLGSLVYRYVMPWTH